MGHATDFAELCDRQSSAACTVAGLRADVSYWRTLAEERADEMRTTQGALQQAAAQINAQALDLIRANLALEAMTERMRHITMGDGDLSLCEWNATAGQWHSMRDQPAMFGELMRQIDEDMRRVA